MIVCALLRYGWHGEYALSCVVQEEFTQRFWQDYTADMLGAIQFGLSHMDSKTQEKVKLYSDYAHRDTRRHSADDMSAQQIIDYILKKL